MQEISSVMVSVSRLLASTVSIRSDIQNRFPPPGTDTLVESFGWKSVSEVLCSGDDHLGYHRCHHMHLSR